MADGASSPLFVPEGTPEGDASASKRRSGGGSGNDNVIGSGSVSIKSEHGTPEPQGATNQAFWDDFNLKIAPIPGANMEPEAKEEKSPSPPRQINASSARGRPKQSPRPFAPLTSRAERNKRKAARESASIERATPNDAIANTALGTASRDMQTAVQLASAAAGDAAMHTTIARNALRGNAAFPPTIEANAAPRGPSFAPPATRTIDTQDLLISAHRHLDSLAAGLRKQQNDACEREDHLASLLEQARDIRARTMQDRSNGLVIIRDRKKRLRELEERILNNEIIELDELVGLVDPLRLEQGVERGEFERMRVEGRRDDHEDGHETDPHGSG